MTANVIMIKRTEKTIFHWWCYIHTCVLLTRFSKITHIRNAWVCEMRVLKTTAYKILHINRGQIRQTLQQLVSNQESSHLHKRWQKFNDITEDLRAGAHKKKTYQQFWLLMHCHWVVICTYQKTFCPSMSCMSAHLGSPGKRAVKRVCVCVCYALHTVITLCFAEITNTTWHSASQLWYSSNKIASTNFREG